MVPEEVMIIAKALAKLDYNISPVEAYVDDAILIYNMISEAGYDIKRKVGGT